ncbi:MAG TPA: AbrB/MazE/SpoVT family DNA-binding domain-containing protein [Terracidiphilus sp.]|jgi:AbrB family looped-hinge helix DNA binding protein|nr:AbrB/MazE/SpoVT family DNA-binding domain-containing protein [Terracidiphilus sp.]
MRSTAVMSSKGQIVIPAGLRKRYGLREGSTVVFQEEQGRLILEPNNFEDLYALQGSLQGFPLEADLEAERRAERKRQERQ